jgi:hypothetical protein
MHCHGPDPPLANTEPALVVAEEPEDDTAHPAEQSVAGTGVARDAIASRLSAGMPIVIGVAPPPNVVEDAPRV